MPILLEKIRAILRRSAGAQEGTALRYRDLLLDPASREATREGERLDLTAREYALLETFLSAPGRVFTRRRCSTSSGDTTSSGMRASSTATSRTCAISCKGTTSRP